MPEIQHSALTDGDGVGLHEPKGHSTASAGEFLGSNGDGTTSFDQVEGTEIASAGPVAVDSPLVANGSGGAEWGTAPQYGGMYGADLGVSLASIGTTAQKMPAALWAAAMPTNGITVDETTEAEITVPVAGDYYVSFQASFSTVAAGDAGIYQFHLRRDTGAGDVETYMGTHREMSGSSDTGSAGFSGIITLTANDILTVYVESDNGSDTDDLTFQDTQFSVYMLKAT